MNQFLSITLLVSPAIIAVIILFFLTKLLDSWRWFVRRGKKSPLQNKKLFRGPGDGLKEKIEYLSFDINALLLGFPIFILALSPLYIVHMVSFYNGKGNSSSVAVLVIMNLLIFFILGWKILNKWKERVNYYLGLDGELYVGQHLNHLMLLGCRVYHDFPANNFNIDHIVVGPTGIFAIETKARPKPDTGNPDKDKLVIYDGQKLIYSNDKIETSPIKEAKQRAKWLEDWLRSATGNRSLIVEPVLALPGWFIDRKSNKMKVYNGFIVDDNGELNPEKRNLFTFGNTKYNEEQLSRINHQLNAKCRDIEPSAYFKKDKK